MPRSEVVQRVFGIVPGAALLLHADGAREVQVMLRLIDTIEAHGIDPSDERVSALDAHIDGYPPVLIAFGDDEMFRDAIRRFVDQLEAVDVETTVIEAPGMFHVFPILMPWAVTSHRVLREAGELVNASTPSR
jgi:acetyl esterase/lipase